MLWRVYVGGVFFEYKLTGVSSFFSTHTVLYKLKWMNSLIKADFLFLFLLWALLYLWKAKIQQNGMSDTYYYYFYLFDAPIVDN